MTPKEASSSFYDDKYLTACNKYKKIRDKKNRHLTLFNIGTCMIKMAKYDEAIPYFKAAIKIYDEDYNFYYNLGIAYAFSGKINEAIESFRRSLVKCKSQTVSLDIKEMIDTLLNSRKEE